MGAHNHHHLKDVTSGGQTIRSQTFSVSIRLLATLMGGALLLNSIVAQFVFHRSEGQAQMMAMVGACLLGLPVIYHALHSLFTGRSHMDELVALAILAAFAIKDYRLAGVVAFFMLIAELIEARTALGARASIESLIRMTPTRAQRVLEDGSETEVQARLLEKGQTVRVRPGDNIPADGRVVAGESTVNQATITGESLPVDKTIDDQVFAGTTNLTGALDVEVTTAGSDTTLGKVQSLIARAESTKIPLMRIIDRYIGWYIPTILMITVIVLYFYGIHEAIAVLVISCPCALILATPTAMVAALSSAARLGILVKNVQELEAAGKINAIVFDKTGTLTTGLLAVTSLTPAKGVDPADLLSAAASAEQFSKHPAAKALVEVAKQANLKLTKPENFEETAGRGVSAKVDGKPVCVGRLSWLESQGADLSCLDADGMSPPDGVSLLYISSGNKCIGWIGMEDRTRDEARQAIDELSELGIKRLVMVTGDRLAVAQRVAGQMGCTEVKAECLPHEKLDLVHDLQKQHYYVGVVGDGVNDAPALAAGDLGIAMGAAGSDVAINSASIALMNNDLRRLPFLIRLSRTTRRVVMQNLGFGVAFIILGVVFASIGWVPPAVAAFLHLISSMVIVFNSARLVRFGEELGHHEPASADHKSADREAGVEVQKDFSPVGTVRPAGIQP